MRGLLNLLLAFLAKALVTPLVALALLPFAAFAGVTTFLASVLIALRFGYVYTNVGLQFVASYLSVGRRYPRLGPVDIQTDTDTADSPMTPPSSPSDSDPGTVTPSPPRGPLPNYMTGTNYVRPRRRRSTSAAHSPRRGQPSPSAASSAAPSPQPQPDQPPRPATPFPKPSRPPTCSCVNSPSGLLCPSLNPSTSPPSPSTTTDNSNNTWTPTTTSNGSQPGYDSYTEMYRRHCERCFEKRTLWFSLQRSRARQSSESLRAIVEAEEDAPASSRAVPPQGQDGQEELAAAEVDGLPRVTIPRAIPERVGVGTGVEAVEERVGDGADEWSESESGISELDLARTGSSSPGPATVSTSLVSTPPGPEIGKGKGKEKD